MNQHSLRARVFSNFAPECMFLRLYAFISDGTEKPISLDVETAMHAAMFLGF
jgi:hypothetical protein